VALSAVASKIFHASNCLQPELPTSLAVLRWDYYSGFEEVVNRRWPATPRLCDRRSVESSKIPTSSSRYRCSSQRLREGTIRARLTDAAEGGRERVVERLELAAGGWLAVAFASLALQPLPPVPPVLRRVALGPWPGFRPEQALFGVLRAQS
jgi:hypothetical protein